jgi:hypothetical protein
MSRYATLRSAISAEVNKIFRQSEATEEFGLPTKRKRLYEIRIASFLIA